MSLRDRKSTRLNSSHTEIYTLSLHDALPISVGAVPLLDPRRTAALVIFAGQLEVLHQPEVTHVLERSEEHTSELQSHRDLHSFPTRRSSDLSWRRPTAGPAPNRRPRDLCRTT